MFPSRYLSIGLLVRADSYSNYPCQLLYKGVNADRILKMKINNNLFWLEESCSSLMMATRLR